MEFIIASALLTAGYLVSNKQNEKFTDNTTKSAPTTEPPTYRSVARRDLKNKKKDKITSQCAGPRRSKTAECPYPSSSETHLQGRPNDKVILLSGEVVDKKHFRHGNMAPYFGSKLTQNVDLDSPRTTLELFTGSGKCRKGKKECKPFFKLQKNSGTRTSKHMRDIGINLENRYHCSRGKKCELPFKQIRVGPGLNQGFTANPSGGFGHNNTRDFVIPKTVDELRTLNNPKLSYSGRILPPKKINKRAQQSKVYKHRPDTFYKNSPDRYFKTTGSVLKERTRSEKYTDTKRKQLKSDPVRNAYTKLTDVISKVLGDYGKDRYNLPATERQVSGVKTHLTNLVTTVKALITPLQDTLRKTKKENFVGAARQVGNVGMQIPNKMTTYDPNDVARTTIKETLLQEAAKLNVSGPKKLIVYDPNDIARITGRNTLNCVDTHLNLSGQLKSKVYDPTDKARTTVKETTVGKNKTGIVSGRSQGDGYKIAEFVAPTTMKEITTENSNYSGNPDLQYVGGRGYLTNEQTAPNTNRQFTSDHEYSGVAGSYIGEHTSQENMCNAQLNVNKEKIAKGRPPTQNNVKLASGGDTVSIRIRKNDCDRENHRGATGFTGHTIITGKDNCSMTGLRHDKVEDDRLDRAILDSLKNNPYAKRILDLKL